jgi:Mg2+ and Co2+ transporter CorA
MIDCLCPPDEETIQNNDEIIQSNDEKFYDLIEQIQDDVNSMVKRISKLEKLSSASHKFDLRYRKMMTCRRNKEKLVIQKFRKLRP